MKNFFPFQRNSAPSAGKGLFSLGLLRWLWGKVGTGHGRQEAQNGRAATKSEREDGKAGDGRGMFVRGIKLQILLPITLPKHSPDKSSRK
jgi:hypothetical protein